MPELPEVEVLVSHLRPLLTGRKIREVRVLRPKVLGRTRSTSLRQALIGATFKGMSRRGKYLLFDLQSPELKPVQLIGHLGMTGRMYMQEASRPLPKHAAVTLQLDQGRFVYEDPRYFGRLTLDDTSLTRLGPEPLSPDFSAMALAKGLSRSRQPIKVKLLDQTLLAGIGNIYANEALFRAGIHPSKPARSLGMSEISSLTKSLRRVLQHAIRFGSTLPLTFDRKGGADRLLYFGTPKTGRRPQELLQVYDRAGKPCRRCDHPIARIKQAGRSTYYCPGCQARKRP